MTSEFSSIPESLESFGAHVAIVLGSGLNSFVDSLEIDGTIPYTSIPGLPASTVPGHHGQFALARINGHPLLVAQGRVHLYEGWKASEITTGIRLMHRIGIQKLILTNAAGTLNPNFAPGSWMMLSDHINLSGATPLLGSASFIDLTEAYDAKIRETFRATAAALGTELHEGVYASLLGPQYETPAEVRMLRTLGADAVGMSTVLETIQARALGLEVCAFSCLTNWAAGITGELLSHEEVSDTGKTSASVLTQLLTNALPELLKTPT